MTRTPDERQRLIDTLRQVIYRRHVAMLTTTSEDGMLRSRPMIPALHEFDGDIWFFALETTSPVEDVRHHSEVNVTYTDPSHDQFVSTTGTAEIVRDRQKMELLWKDELQDWFPDGVQTPQLVLLRIAVEEAEIWDKQPSSVEGLLSSMISWTASMERVHEKIQWRDPPHGAGSEKGAVPAPPVSAKETGKAGVRPGQT